MASRHLSRSIAMQTLYEWDFNDREDAALNTILEKNLVEFGPGLEDKEFSRELVHGVLSKIGHLNTIIEKAAPEWPLEQIAIVDRNILRLGLYELLFGDHAAVPPKVAINEAIELAKGFGGESSGKFVNGVLGTVYRELGEPGKEHPRGGGAEARRGEDGTPAKPDRGDLRKEEYAGAVIFWRKGEKISWAMVHDIFGHWTFVKGHRQPDESLEEAALRQVKEEVGLTGAVITTLGLNTYPATTERGENVLRHVTYFLIETSETELTLEENAGLTAAQWFPMEDVMATKHYPDTNHIIEAAMEKISNLSNG